MFIVPDVMSGDIRGRQDPNEERKKEKKRRRIFDRIQGLCESRGGRPGFPVRNNSYGFCGRKVKFDEE